MNDFRAVVRNTGMADWFRFKKRCPVYWRGKPEEVIWKEGYEFMNGFNKGPLFAG